MDYIELKRPQYNLLNGQFLNQQPKQPQKWAWKGETYRIAVKGKGKDVVAVGGFSSMMIDG